MRIIVMLALAFNLQSCGRLGILPFGTPSAAATAKSIQVGQPAPEIAGIDMTGTPLKLSEQRGNVVALVFWGHW